MRLITRDLFVFVKSVETDVKLTDPFDNGADMYRRETIGLSGFAINTLTERSSEDVQHVSVNGQKKGFTVSISNLLKRSAKFLIAYFLVQNSDVRSQRVVDDFSKY